MSEESLVFRGRGFKVGKSIRLPKSLRLSTAVGITFLALVMLLILVVPLLPSYHPYAQDVERAEMPINSIVDGQRFLLGTDQLGRDVLSRLALAGGVALRLSFGAIVIAVFVGTLLGVLAGYFRGWVDRVISSITDIQLAIPRILLLITAIAVFSRSLLLLTVLLGLSSWMPFARIVRSGAMSLRGSEFIMAARAAGASHARIMVRHMLPHLFSSIVIIAAIDLGMMVLLEAALSFLGLGVAPPDTSWGLMIYEAQNYVYTSPHLILLPGLCIFLFVAGINFASMDITDESS